MFIDAGCRINLIVSALSIFLAVFVSYSILTSNAEAALVSPDGSIITGGTGSLTNSNGTLSFGTAYPGYPGNWNILLNSLQVGIGSKIEIANGGQAYALGKSATWYVWQNSAWAVTTNPAPPSLSTDGSAITGGAGSLKTVAGTWAFGTAYPGYPGNWNILLNSQQVGTGSTIEIANGGQLYALGKSGAWYVWQNGVWAVTTNPSPPSLPPPNAPAAPPIDSAITLNSTSDIVSRRATLISHLFQSTNLPSAQSVVTQKVTSPFPTFTNIARVDRYVAAMSNGQTNVSNVYMAGPINNNRMVILNAGHQFTCDWAAFHSGYRIQIVLQALLNNGFSVYAMNMPNCGDAASHDQLFQSYGDVGMRYFIEPIVQAFNYMDNHYAFLSYDMVGLSGGGWTTTVAAAVDPRIKYSVAVAGSMPGVHFVPGSSGSASHGDAEQNYANYFSLAGYLDHYMLGASGSGRRHTQILNYYDDCCFGNAQWISPFSFQSSYGMDWLTYLSTYSAAIASKQAQLGNMNYQLVVDNVANQHQISTYAQSLILSLFSR